MELHKPVSFDLPLIEQVQNQLGQARTANSIKAAAADPAAVEAQELREWKDQVNQQAEVKTGAEGKGFLSQGAELGLGLLEASPLGGAAGAGTKAAELTGAAPEGQSTPSAQAGKALAGAEQKGEEGEQKAAKALGSWTETLAKILSDLLNPETWLRVLKFIIGGVLLILALVLFARAAGLGASTPVTQRTQRFAQRRGEQRNRPAPGQAERVQAAERRRKAAERSRARRQPKHRPEGYAHERQG